MNNISIDEIDFSVRTKNALHHAGYHSLSQVLELTEDILYSVRNMGQKSVDEVLSFIGNYDGKQFNDEIPKDEISDDEVIAYLNSKRIGVDKLEGLSTKAFNVLLLNDIKFVSQIAFISKEELLKFNKMDCSSADNVIGCLNFFVNDLRARMLANKEDILATMSVSNAMRSAKYCSLVKKYVLSNDISIDMLGLSNRPRNQLMANSYLKLSDIVFLTNDQLKKIPKMGDGSIAEIRNVINNYITENSERILAFITGDKEKLYDDEFVQKSILNLYTDRGFSGLNLSEIINELDLSDDISVERIKSNIAFLISKKQIEYVDYRCYRVYPSFYDCIDKYGGLDERSIYILENRINGEKSESELEIIGQKLGITRERVRQLQEKAIKKVKASYTASTGMKFFDEDYYTYLFINYSINNDDAEKWLGMSKINFNYFKLMSLKNGTKPIVDAVDDPNIDFCLKIKIKNYLNRNKIFIDDCWVNKKRTDLERFVVKKYCQSDVSFDDFCVTYNRFLEKQGISQEENLYITQDVYRTRENYIRESLFLLWKQGSIIRSYDVEGRDFFELLEALNIPNLKNIELSTLKLFEDNLELMKKYDIQDHYELHNLLRKVIKDGEFNGFKCGRTPIIGFGEFDRIHQVVEIIENNSPLSIDEFYALAKAEYGYETGAILWNDIEKYYYQGIFTVDYLKMPVETAKKLNSILVDDFYYIDEIKNIYQKVFPNNDVEEINAYSLKQLGFSVYTKYVMRNHDTLDKYFENLLTHKDIQDISLLRAKFVYVQAFWQVLNRLKKERNIVEFDRNQIISIDRLEAFGFGIEEINEFCDSVYEYCEDGQCFSIESLLEDEFSSPAFDLGFPNWFYANILAFDERFSYGKIFSNIVLYKGKIDVTIKFFVSQIIKQNGAVDIYDLMNIINDAYGCTIKEKTDLVYAVRDTIIYYDDILERFYPSVSAYEREIFGMEK